MGSFSTIAQMFQQSVENKPEATAYFDKVDGKWQKMTFKEVGDMVEKISAGLVVNGINKGDKVAILATNCSKWTMADYAITSLGAATVTIYPTLIAAQIKYIVEDSETRLVFTEDQEQTGKILEILPQVPNLKLIIQMKGAVQKADNIIGFNGLLESGEKYIAESKFDLRKISSAISPDDLLTLIYTSGTTGNPKGVMLTHNNLVSNIQNSRKSVMISAKDIFLSFLPLSHSFERMVGHLLAFSANCTVYFAENMETVAENMLEVHPTVVVAVPRFFEKVHAKVLASVADYSPVKKTIFNWSIKVGCKSAPLLQKNSLPSGFLGFKFGIADKLVFAKLKDRVGGALRFFVSGGAPLSKEIGEFFAAANIPILEGYGLTETSPVISVNKLELYKFGTVGPAIEGIEVKIADDGEILVKGDNIMKGYYNNPVATAQAIDSDGWFHTGDIGFLDEDNYLVITDRKKNMLVTSGGKNVAPAQLENAMVMSKYIEQCMAIGNRRKFISALIVPSRENIMVWAEENGLSAVDYSMLLNDPKVHELIAGELERLMMNFARYEAVKKFILLPDLWTISGGEITPSLKIKRKVIEENFAQLIESIYA